ncbi:MAG: hypothetical protein LBS40_03250 [Burkholderiales bacterium]|jgi:predicted outer membrane repeat protein|nr:hypothetical protein [Burkholderiales bacterium]
MINKPKHHQRTSLPPCREAKHHKAKHHKKVWLSAFAAAMLCMGIAAQAATITVNSSVDALTDSDKCTLRGAVGSVNAGNNQNNCVAVASPDAYGSNDTITFDTAVFNTATTIDVTASGEIAITRSLTIEGLLDGGGAPLITLDGKSANRILNGSGTGFVLTVSGLAFQNGHVGSVHGGAIYAGNNATVIVRNSAFKNNRAGVSGNGSGGAIYTSGGSATVIVRNSTFEGNQASVQGGAIFATTADVSNSAFEKNQANSSFGGGAIYASTANVSNSTFEDNRVNGGSRGGGAISAATAHVSDSAFENNQSSISGGAIHASGTVNISNSTFEKNQANSNGGAISAATANVSDSTFENNQINSNGGAIRVSAANISNSTFEGNQANGTYGRGGAIYVGTTLEASHLTLLDNSAGQNGAAIHYQGSGNVSIDNSLILSSAALVGATALCSISGTLTGNYNIEWVDGVDVASPSCGTTNRVLAGSGAIGAIVETTLADNGGPTLTLALPAGSPAIGAVDPSGVTSQMLIIDFSSTPVTATWEDATLDQRGVTRGTTPAERSLGAFEYKAPPPPVNGATSIPVLPMPLALLLALGVAGIGSRRLKAAGR